MALILAFIMFVPRKLLSFKDFMSNIATGINTMVPAYIILTLAWTIGTLCQSYLGTGKFIGMLVEQSHLPVELIPAIVFLVSAGLSFPSERHGVLLGSLFPLSSSSARLLPVRS